MPSQVPSPFLQAEGELLPPRGSAPLGQLRRAAWLPFPPAPGGAQGSAVAGKHVRAALASPQNNSNCFFYTSLHYANPDPHYLCSR